MAATKTAAQKKAEATAKAKQEAEEKAAAEAAAAAQAQDAGEPVEGELSDVARDVLEQRIEDLERENKHLTDVVGDLQERLAAKAGDAPAEVEEPEAGTNVWLRAGDGREWEVTVGHSVYERLRSEGAQIIEGPTGAAEESA